MTKTFVPAQPDEIAIEIWTEKGAVRSRPHRVIAWSIDEHGVPDPIGATGPFDVRKDLFYQQPGGGLLALDGTNHYFPSIEDAADMIVGENGVRQDSQPDCTASGGVAWRL
jgi:hypothetical protein